MDSQNLKTQVVIIGAGPTGLSLAVQLLRYNIGFIIIEKNERPTHLSKAMVVQARTLEIFQEAGIAATALKEGQETTGLNMFYKGKQKVALNLGDIGKGLSSFTFSLSLEQSKTEKILADHLAASEKLVQWKSEFSHFEQDENKVTVFFKDASGNDQKIEAKYLIGCDGASSPLRHQLSLTFEGDTEPKLFYVADVKLESSVIYKNELFMFLIKKGFVLFFPMKEKEHYRVIGVLPSEKKVKENFQFSDIEDFIKQQIISPVEFKEVCWFSSYKVHSRRVNAFISGRCCLAGDAAHIHTPAGGQGMNTGIQDAYNLAWKLALILNKKIKPAVLETYNTERLENAKHLLKTTDKAFDLMAGTNKITNLVRLTFIPLIASIVSRTHFFNKKIFSLLSQINISYPTSKLTIKSSIGKVHAGMRMPYCVFSNGRNIFEYLIQPAFKLLFFGNTESQSAAFAAQYKTAIAVYDFKEIPKSLFGGDNGFYILLRPDNHISYIGKDLAVCKNFLDEIVYQKT